MRAAKRHMLTAIGLFMVALGIIGAFLPILPTTPFLLVALACFSRSFPRLEAWLLDHPRFGPPLHNWRRSGAISGHAKAIAVASMALSYVFFLVMSPVGLPLRLLVLAILCACALFVLTRPLPQPGPAPRYSAAFKTNNSALYDE